jgi:hypothetical protein
MKSINQQARRYKLFHPHTSYFPSPWPQYVFSQNYAVKQQQSTLRREVRITPIQNIRTSGKTVVWYLLTIIFLDGTRVAGIF